MPRSAVRFSVLIAALVALAACAGGPQAPGAAPPAAAPVSADQDFLNRAATGGVGAGPAGTAGFGSSSAPGGPDTNAQDCASPNTSGMACETGR